VSTPYSPSTAQALAVGATEEGWVESSGVGWDGFVASYNLRAVEQRLTILAEDLRDNIAALRRDLAIPSVGNVKLFCVGDSITAGALTVDGIGYRSWLAEALARRHITSQTPTCAYPGQTLRYVAPKALAQLPAVQPDIVLVHLGTNCAMQNDLADWQNRLGAFVDQILASSPAVRVAVARISLGRDTTVAGRENTINGYVDAVVAARQASGRVASADMTVVDQRWTDDGIHPLDAGHLRIAQQWLTAISPWLPSTA
jgi:lysophospholipase L1-like esterase